MSAEYLAFRWGGESSLAHARGGRTTYFSDHWHEMSYFLLGPPHHELRVDRCGRPGRLSAAVPCQPAWQHAGGLARSARELPAILGGKGYYVGSIGG